MNNITDFFEEKEMQVNYWLNWPLLRFPSGSFTIIIKIKDAEGYIVFTNSSSNSLVRIVTNIESYLLENHTLINIEQNIEDLVENGINLESIKLDPELSDKDFALLVFNLYSFALFLQYSFKGYAPVYDPFDIEGI